MTAGEIERRMSGRELVEWSEFLSLEGRVQAQIAKGMDSQMADQMIWSLPTPAGKEPAKKKTPKGKG